MLSYENGEKMAKQWLITRGSCLNEEKENCRSWLQLAYRKLAKSYLLKGESEENIMKACLSLKVKRS